MTLKKFIYEIRVKLYHPNEGYEGILATNSIESYMN